MKKLLFPQFCTLCSSPLAESSEVFCYNCIKKMASAPVSLCMVCGSYQPQSMSSCYNCSSYGEGTALNIYQIYAYRAVIKQMLRVCKRKKVLYAKEFWADVLMKNFPFFWKYDALVPVPSLKKQWFGNGGLKFMDIAEVLKRKYNLPVIRMISKKNHREKKNLNSAQRLSEKYFYWTKPEYKAPGRVLLMDDIFTTGSSVLECSALLRFNGAVSVDVLVIARV